MIKWILTQITYGLFMVAGIPSLVILYITNIERNAHDKANDSLMSVFTKLSHKDMNAIINNQEEVIKQQMSVIEILQGLLDIEMKRNKELLDDRDKMEEV